MKNNGVRITVDASRCSGCRTCELVCAMEHYAETNPKKAALKVVGHFPVPGHYEVRTCTQCGDCAEVCPTSAIKEQNDVYYIDEEECISCDACVSECPHNVMFTHPDLSVPIKCDGCGECVKYCPMNAIQVVVTEGSEVR